MENKQRNPIVHNTVVPLRNSSVISILEDLLDAARRGQLRSIFAAGRLGSDETVVAHSYCSSQHKFELLGHLFSDAVSTITTEPWSGE